MTSDEQLLLSDQTAREDALDVTRSFIVQAPAGSGKTELLIQRYLNLLAVVEHPEEIIAITFTRKAAAEMQHRVLEALRRRQSEQRPSEAHEMTTYELAGKALAKSATHGWNLIGNPRRMRILTLDALNASIAKARPLTSASAGARIVVGAELQSLLQAASMATLDWLVEKGDLQAATNEVLQHVDNNTALYASYLSQMLATRDQWLPFVGSGLLTADDAEQLRRRFEASLQFAVTQHLAETEAALEAVAGLTLPELFNGAAVNMIEADLAANPIAGLADLTALPEPSAEQMHLWQGVAELLLTQKGEFRKKVDKRQGFPAGNKAPKDQMHAVLAELAEDPGLADLIAGIRALPPTRYTDEQWRVLLALFRLLPLAVSELKRLCNERGVTDHIDVALTASAALGTADNPGDVALLLDYQVQHLLVDEMQDTSAAQYRMLETLTAGWEPGDGRSLYCVGDPMQSIYRFRNAEVGQFLLAKQYGIGHISLEPLLLRRNFRSGENLVEWFNAVFPAILAAKDDPLRSAVSYSAAVPVPHLAGQGRALVHPVFGAESGDEASAGLRLIASTLEGHPDDDMVVLVRGRTQLPELLSRLRAAGIPYRAVEIDRLTDLPEVIDLIALTRAAAHPGDRIAWLGLLRAPWIGLDWSDIHTLVRNDADSTVWELLQTEGRLAALSEFGRGAIAAARESLARLTQPRREKSLRDLVEQCWFELGGPGTQTDSYTVENVYRYLEVLGSMEQAGTLIDVAELESTLDLERVSSNEEARLQIMTMHRAKGLQFDHVLLYGLGRQPGRSDRRVLSWFDLPGGHGSEQKVISPVGPRAEVENDPVHRYIELTEAAKDRHEQARLLYVACTRAKKSLHIMGNTAVAPDGQSIRPARSDSLLHLLWPAIAEDFETAFSQTEYAPAESSAPVWVRPVLRRFSSPWVLPELTPLPQTGPPIDVQENGIETEFYWVGTDARIAGTLVHRWLQLIADGRIRPDASEVQEQRELSARWLREAGLSGERAEPIIARVEEAVINTLSDTRGQWILTGEGHAELALTGSFEGAVVSVVLDRVRIDENGTHWIIDYKTSSHEGGNLEGFLEVEADRYRPQLDRYTTLYQDWSGQRARRALYFPLLRAFVEVAA